MLKFFYEVVTLLFSFFIGVEPITDVKVAEQIVPRNEAKQVKTEAFNSFFMLCLFILNGLMK